MSSNLILASQSMQRQTLLKTLGVPFEVMPADIDEKSIVHAEYTQRVQMIAQAKAEKVQRSYPDAVIIAADTVIVHNDQVFEKPTNITQAKKMLTSFSDQWIKECTGVYCVAPSTLNHGAELLSTVCTVKAKFRQLLPGEINTYVEKNPVLTWAGAISPAYPEGMALFEQVQGSITGFTHGFPMEIVVPFLRKVGYI